MLPTWIISIKNHISKWPLSFKVIVWIIYSPRVSLSCSVALQGWELMQHCLLYIYISSITSKKMLDICMISLLMKWTRYSKSEAYKCLCIHLHSSVVQRRLQWPLGTHYVWFKTYKRCRSVRIHQLLPGVICMYVIGPNRPVIDSLVESKAVSMLRRCLNELDSYISDRM